MKRMLRGRVLAVPFCDAAPMALFCRTEYAFVVLLIWWKAVQEEYVKNLWGLNETRQAFIDWAKFFDAWVLVNSGARRGTLRDTSSHSSGPPLHCPIVWHRVKACWLMLLICSFNCLTLLEDYVREKILLTGSQFCHLTSACAQHFGSRLISGGGNQRDKSMRAYHFGSSVHCRYALSACNPIPDLASCYSWIFDLLVHLVRLLIAQFLRSRSSCRCLRLWSLSIAAAFLWVIIVSASWRTPSVISALELR